MKSIFIVLSLLFTVSAYAANYNSANTGAAIDSAVIKANTAVQPNYTGDLAITGNETISGLLGVGPLGAAPASPIDIISSGTSIPMGAINMRYTSTGASPQYFIAPNISFYRNNDVSVNSGFPRLGDSIGQFSFGTMSGVTKQNRALIYSRAEKDWTAIDEPSNFQFLTNIGSNAANREQLRLSSNGIATFNGGVQLFPFTGTGGDIVLGSGASNKPAKPTATEATMGTLWVNSRNTVANGGIYSAPTKLEISVESSSGVYGWKEIQAFNATNVVYWCNGGTNSGLLGRGNAGPCPGGTWTATAFRLD